MVQKRGYKYGVQLMQNMIGNKHWVLCTIHDRNPLGQRREAFGLNPGCFRDKISHEYGKEFANISRPIGSMVRPQAALPGRGIPRMGPARMWNMAERDAEPFQSPGRRRAAAGATELFYNRLLRRLS